MAMWERFDARGDPLIYRRAGNKRDGRQSGIIYPFHLVIRHPWHLQLVRHVYVTWG
jgi:hypothetical protein